MEQKPKLKINKTMDKCCEVKTHPKQVQYFTLGKNKSLIHHPTTHINKSSPNAVFCRTNPFKTQKNPISSRKCESFHPANKYTSPHRNAITKLSQSLKQDHPYSSNSNKFSVIIEGKAIKHKPTGYVGTSDYCQGMKHCAMCGKVMLGWDSELPPASKQTSFANPYQNARIRSKVDRVGSEGKGVHSHCSKLKKCVMCSKPFIQPCDPRFCKERQNNEKSIENPSFPLKTRMNDIQNLSSALPKPSVLLISKHCQAKKRTLLNSFQGINVDKCSEKLHLINEKFAQTKSTLKTNGFFSKSKHQTSNFDSHNKKQVNETYLANEKSRANKITINSIAKSLSNESQTVLSSTSQNLLSKINVKSDSSKRQSACPKSIGPFKNYLSEGSSLNISEKNIRASKSTYVPTKLQQSSKANTELDNSLDDFTWVISDDGEEIVNTKKSYTIFSAKKKSPPVLTTSLIDTDINVDALPKVNTIPINTSKNSALVNYVTTEEPLNKTCGSDAAIYGRKTNLPTQTTSLVDTSLVAGETSQKSENAFEATVLPNASPSNAFNNPKSPFDEKQYQEPNAADKSTSMGKTNKVIHESLIQEEQDFLSKSAKKLIDYKDSDRDGEDKKSSSDVISEIVIDTKQCGKTSIADKTTLSTKLNSTVNKALTKEEQDFVSKCAEILSQNKGLSNYTNNRSSSPIVQNVNVNNYYFVPGSHMPKVLFDSSASLNTKYLSPEMSLVSEAGDELLIDEAYKQIHKSPENLKSFCDSTESLKQTKCFLEKLFATHCYGENRKSLHKSDVSVHKVSSYLRNDLHWENMYSDILNQNGCLRQTRTRNAGTNSTNPYIENALRICEEMKNIRNEPIDHEKIVEELKKNASLMKMVEQMAAKNLNFPRKSTVFKSATSKK